MKKSNFPILITFLVIAFLYLPILLLMVSSFNESRFGEEWTGFSFRWYVRLFHDQDIWNGLKNTLIVGLSATVLSTLLGTMAAFAIYRYKTTLQNIQYGLVYAPLVVPDLLMGMSLLLLFISFGMPLGLMTIILAHTTFCISYVAMVVLARMDTFDYSVIEAAQDLGAQWWIVVFKVVVPVLSPGIISGALLAFTISIDDYIVTSFVSGPGSATLPIHVYGMMKFGATPVINALSTLILTITFILTFCTQMFTKESIA